MPGQRTSKQHVGTFALVRPNVSAHRGKEKRIKEGEELVF